MVDAEAIKLDRWTVVFHQDQDKRVATVPETNSSKTSSAAISSATATPTTTSATSKMVEKRKNIRKLNLPPPSIALPVRDFCLEL